MTGSPNKNMTNSIFNNGIKIYYFDAKANFKNIW